MVMLLLVDMVIVSALRLSGSRGRAVGIDTV
jgi:hypothetical protein